NPRNHIGGYTGSVLRFPSSQLERQQRKQGTPQTDNRNGLEAGRFILPLALKSQYESSTERQYGFQQVIPIPNKLIDNKVDRCDVSHNQRNKYKMKLLIKIFNSAKNKKARLQEPSFFYFH